MQKTYSISNYLHSKKVWSKYLIGSLEQKCDVSGDERNVWQLAGPPRNANTPDLPTYISKYLARDGAAK